MGKVSNKQQELVGGFNPFEKYKANRIISPNRDENEKYLKPPPTTGFFPCQVVSRISSINRLVLKPLSMEELLALALTS